MNSSLIPVLNKHKKPIMVWQLQYFLITFKNTTMSLTCTIIIEFEFHKLIFICYEFKLKLKSTGP